MSTANYYALFSRLRKVTATDGGVAVEGLDIEPDDNNKPKRITGFILEPGPNETRRVACSWLPSGRHRLRDSLNLTIPEE